MIHKHGSLKKYWNISVASGLVAIEFIWIMLQRSSTKNDSKKSLDMLNIRDAILIFALNMCILQHLLFCDSLKLMASQWFYWQMLRFYCYHRYYDREDLAIEQEGCVPVPQPLRG